MRRLYLAAGLLFVALGFVGAFLPVLPTTPFLIVAVACFARSSPRLESWLLDHPRFGPLLRQWRERGAIPRRAKLMSLAGCSLGFLLFWIGHDPEPVPAIAVASLMLVGVTYVFSRPSA
ncbi:YbaN family protein [Pseudochelatococcus sp. B33]